VECTQSSGKLYCCYAEDLGFDSPFKTCAFNHTSFIWKCDRHFAIYSAPSLEIELSLHSARRTILLRSSLEYISDIVFSDMRISKVVLNASAQHALGQWSSTPGPRSYKMYSGVDTTRFLGMLLVESSPANTVAKVPWATAKLSSVDWSAVTKGLEATGLVYIFQTLLI